MRKLTLVEKLSELGEAFTIEDIRSNTNMTKSGLKKFLFRLEKQGWIERIEKGKYMRIPVEAEKGKYTLNQFVIASMLVEPYCISYWSALHHYGFTEQIPSTVFIQTTARKKHQNIEIFGINYKIIRLTPEKFFGQNKEWFINDPIMITDKEKTIVDCLDKPQYCGGMIEVIKGIREREFDPNLISKYASKIKNTGVIRRLGFLSDYYGLELKLPNINKNIRNYLLLDPTMPDEGKKNSKWRLTINLNEYDLENVE
ncbi:MAG: hypothetical protein KAJ33_06345 [Thermoplasmata archaeon]|nr:hypothetical protein [Thermoplasmata archaeon]MCK5397847.1 hypothetical protein [Thermoplasmata archaeon]